jgi:hypothetical protein
VCRKFATAAAIFWHLSPHRKCCGDYLQAGIRFP